MKSPGYFSLGPTGRLAGKAAAVAFLIAFGASNAFATSLGVNLIVNPGAELSSGAADFDTTVVPVGWVTTSNFSAVQDAAGGATDLNVADSAAIAGGSNYFAGGVNNDVSTASQTIAFADLASSADAGLLSFVLSGYLGGFTTQADSIQLAASFLDAANTVLSTSTIGPVSNVDRNNESQLLLRTTGLTAVPLGARSLNLVLTSTRAEGSYNDGMLIICPSSFRKANQLSRRRRRNPLRCRNRPASRS